MPAHVSEAKKALKESLNEAKQEQAKNASLSCDQQKKIATAVTLLCLRQAVAERAASVGKDGKGHYKKPDPAVFSNLLQCLAVLDSPDESFCVESLRILKSKVKVLWDMDAALSIVQQDEAEENNDGDEMAEQTEDVENLIPKANNTRSKNKNNSTTVATNTKIVPSKSILKAAKEKKEQANKNVYFKINANATNYNND